MSDPYVLLVPAGDPLTHLARKLTPADLAGRDLIGKDCGTASQRALSSALSDYGLGTPRIRAHDLREVEELVRRGLGVAVVPELLLDGPDPTIDRLPVDHFIPDRVIALTTRANGARTPAVELAAAIIRGAAVADDPSDVLGVPRVPALDLDPRAEAPAVAHRVRLRRCSAVRCGRCRAGPGLPRSRRRCPAG